MTVVDDYLMRATPGQVAEFERISGIAKEIIPEMEIGLSYGVIAFKSGKKNIFYFGVYKKHMSLYPIFDDIGEVVGEEVQKRRVSKATLHFNETDPIPDSTIRAIIELLFAKYSK